MSVERVDNRNRDVIIYPYGELLLDSQTQINLQGATITDNTFFLHMGRLLYRSVPRREAFVTLYSFLVEQSPLPEFKLATLLYAVVEKSRTTRA